MSENLFMVCVLIILFLTGLCVGISNKPIEPSKVQSVISYDFDEFHRIVGERLEDGWEMHGSTQVQIIVGQNGGQQPLIVQVLKK